MKTLTLTRYLIFCTSSRLKKVCESPCRILDYLTGDNKLKLLTVFLKLLGDGDLVTILEFLFCLEFWIV